MERATQQASAVCIARGCGKTFDTRKPETRAQETLRPFWMRYCPGCRVTGKTYTAIVAQTEATREADDMASNRKVATLTPEQDARWETLFAIEVNGGASEREADARAWDGLCEEWPELAKCDGAAA